MRQSLLDILDEHLAGIAGLEEVHVPIGVVVDTELVMSSGAGQLKSASFRSASVSFVPGTVHLVPVLRRRNS